MQKVIGTKKIWEFINEALDNKCNKTNYIPTILNHQNQCLTDNISIANEFNSFFVSIGTNILNKLKSSLSIRKCKFLNDKNNPITTDKIKKCILNIKLICSFNRWELTNTILKAIIFNILTPLQYIFNHLT